MLGPGPAQVWVLAGDDRAAALYRRQGFAADGATRLTDHGRDLRRVRPAAE